MLARRVPPEYELVIYRGFEQELTRRLDLTRLIHSPPLRRRSVADRLLLRLGDALIAFGQWVRARSVGAELVGSAGER